MSTDKSPSEEAAELRDKLDGLRASDPAPHVAAAKQQVSDTAANVAANVSDTVNQTASTMKETAANVRDAVVPPLRQGADAVRGAVATARDKAQQASDGAEALSDRIRDQPFLALGLAVLTGYVLGRAYR
jgi:ElaB/YqjD/DUF883 family membrane-anchored ribosome-binding protein